MDDKQKKLILLLNKHIANINPVVDLVQNFSKKKSFLLLLDEKNVEAVLYYELCKKIGNYAQWYTTALLLKEMKSIIDKVSSADLKEQLNDLMFGIELISYRPTHFSDQTQIATLVTATETCFNQLIKLTPGSELEKKLTPLRKQLHDMSNEFQVRETRRHEQSENQKIQKHKEALEHAVNVLSNCLLKGDFSSIAVIDQSNRNRLLEVAAFIGNYDLVKKVLTLNPNITIDFPNEDDCCALELAIMNGHKSVAKLLKENKAQIDRKNNTGNTILQKAAIEENKTAVKLCLDLGADIDLTNMDKLSAFELAVRHGHSDIAQYLFEKANINRTEAGKPFLHRLVTEKNDSGIKLLLTLAKDAQRLPEVLDATDQNERTAWDEILKEPTYQMLALFKQYGAKLEGKHSSLLHDAAKNADLNLIVILSDLDCDFKIADDEGNTALHLAFMHADLTQPLDELAKTLIQEGLDGATKNSAGKTALEVLKMRDDFSSLPKETLSRIEKSLNLQEAQKTNMARADFFNALFGWSPFYDSKRFTEDSQRKPFFASKEEFRRSVAQGITVEPATSVSTSPKSR
jgi:ankyrin repeat protein